MCVGLISKLTREPGCVSLQQTKQSPREPGCVSLQQTQQSPREPCNFADSSRRLHPWSNIFRRNGAAKDTILGKSRRGFWSEMVVMVMTRNERGWLCFSKVPLYIHNTTDDIQNSSTTSRCIGMRGPPPSTRSAFRKTSSIRAESGTPRAPQLKQHAPPSLRCPSRSARARNRKKQHDFSKLDNAFVCVLIFLT